MRGMRNGKRQTSYDRAREILKQAAYGVLSTSCEDGLPYGVPLCHVLTGNSIYFIVPRKGRSWTISAGRPRLPDRGLCRQEFGEPVEHGL